MKAGDTGTLYVVATPIGNLEDMSPRAVRILREVSVILAEDTRVTAKLCRRFDIATRRESFHEHNEDRRRAGVLDRLRTGHDVALVSDAGTPLVSDPGFGLVREAAELGLRVVPVPGPSALTAALSASGLPPTPFCFLGFLPSRGAEASRVLREAPVAMTVVLYEAPHRLAATLRRLAEETPDRPVVVARELTKLHEEILRGSAAELAERMEARTVKGEVVLLLGPGVPPPRREVRVADLTASFQRALAEGLSRTEALRKLSRETGLKRRELYRRLMVQGESGSAVDPSE